MDFCDFISGVLNILKTFLNIFKYFCFGGQSWFHKIYRLSGISRWDVGIIAQDRHQFHQFVDRLCSLVDQSWLIPVFLNSIFIPVFSLSFLDHATVWTDERTNESWFQFCELAPPWPRLASGSGSDIKRIRFRRIFLQHARRALPRAAARSCRLHRARHCCKISLELLGFNPVPFFRWRLGMF